MTSPETRTVPVGDRNVAVRSLGESQLVVLLSEAQSIQRRINRANEQGATDEDRKSILSSVDRVFRILKSVMVLDDDREYVTDLMSEDRLSLADLIEIISAFKESKQAPQVRRKPGRPKKS